jgi:hypothetical protein
MENKKLIKTIKKRALKQFENDLKDSVLKELYGSASKKQIKKIRKQILREMQEELFGTKDVLKTKEKEEVSSPEFIHTNTVDINDFDTKPSEESKEQEQEQETPVHEPGKIFEYKGFKFDVDRMSAIVTGKKVNKVISEPGVERTDEAKEHQKSRLGQINNLFSISREVEPPSNKYGIEDRIAEVKNGTNKESIKKLISKQVSSNTFPTTPKSIQGFKFKIGPGIPGLNSMNMVPSSRNFVKTELEKITPAQKEEISFFVGKLKEGVDSLGKGEKNIMYRKKRDDVYTFSFDKDKLNKDDFSFKFELDLNMYTYGAKINTFSFNIDGFNFDKGFVEILDIIEVLEAVGINLMKYIDEINDINDTAADRKSKIKENLKNNAEAIRANTKLAKFIFDQRILRVLQSNDINTYGQLKKIEDLTSLKGVGAKTVEYIEQQIKKQ